ncbi:AAA family ATPase [Aminithiophilus ramosus]|uniref:AAA family ATPase n=2 Tax=Synergistales TaxID=649776 RepID=A0A9Q7ALA2_9BACT|nr:AAA family ATPase [Aminithiophilus ramosus]QTX31543.1 AAA family ATPase [Aminithiophilus ramosus]QVL35350.1 AAA family ATPase [Synergistota bacterium]
MRAPALTFFNNKGGVGKTSLIYHLAWMFARLRKRVVAIDLDPQANLTAAFLAEERIEAIWDGQEGNATVYQCVKPLTGVGDITEPSLQNIATDLYFLPGDVSLSGYEDALSAEWPNSMGDANLYRPMRILSSFWQVMQMAANRVQADIILIDIGPNLGAINRSVLLATDYVAIPLGADLFSLRGLSNLGPTLRSWKNLWQKRLDNWNGSRERKAFPNFELPEGRMEPIGYLCQQHGVRMDRPVRAYDKWVQRIPQAYREHVLGQSGTTPLSQQADPYCLATVKHYRSLVPMGQEQRKPIFDLTSADGAIGSHAGAVRDARREFEQLARKIGERMDIAF